jgi:rRNA maturation RNase YbeY
MPKSLILRLHQTRHARGVPPAALRELIQFLMARARRADPAREWGELHVILTDSQGILKFNRASFGRDAVTDVITLTYAPAPGLPAWSSELIVNAELARELGPRYGGAGRELALYLAHGCDHLTGGEDNTPDERRQMRRRELRWLAAAAQAGLIAPLTPARAGRP